MQETFLALWDRAETFDPSIGSLAAVAAYHRAQPHGRPTPRGRAAADTRAAVVGGVTRHGYRGSEEPDADALERVLARGSIVGRVDIARRRRRRPSSSASLRTELQAALAGDAGRRAHRHRDGLRRGPVAVRDRRAARLAARHGQDPDPAGPAAPARGARQRGRARVRPLPGTGRHAAAARSGPRRRRRRWTTTTFCEQLELAAVEPGGLERLVAGDTPERGGRRRPSRGLPVVRRRAPATEPRRPVAS